MSKLLPYFRWYPADAETDDFYAGLNDEQLAFYHRCLNRSWLNDGIPADLDELAAAVHKTRAQIDKMWPKMSRRWVPSPRDASKLVNPRQERERDSAIRKGENNKRVGNANASKTRSDKNAIETPFVHVEGNANGAQHARARADYVSDSPALISSEESAERNQIVPISEQRDLFDEFFAFLPDKSNRDGVFQTWMSLDMGYHEQVKAVACVRRYAESDEVARGVVTGGMKWTAQQHKNNWNGEWRKPVEMATAAERRRAEVIAGLGAIDRIKGRA